MKKTELIQKAAEYLSAEGYLIVKPSSNEHIDLITFGEDKNIPIFVTVFDATKVKVIPMNGFGYSKKAKAKAAQFIEAVKHYMSVYYFGDYRARCDAVYVEKDLISHGINVNRI